MDIGTGKPTAEERAAVPHHLIDVVDPDERYHAARFRADALAAIAAVQGRGRLPVVVGGTGLYVRALLRGLTPAPPADPALRATLEGFAAEHGAPALHARLAAVAPDAARRLHPNDRLRVVRALEVHAGAGAATRDTGAGGLGRHRRRVAPRDDRARPRAPGAQRGPGGARARHAGPWHDGRGPAPARSRPRRARPPMDGIGYRQLAQALRGRMTVEDALRLMIRDTTRYAKRQMTWFQREPEIRWLDVDEAGGVEGAAEAVHKHITQEGLIE